MLTNDELNAIEERERAATEGPWACLPVGTVCEITDAAGRYDDQVYADGEFIAHARTDIPALLQHIREQAAELERLQYELAETRHAQERIKAQQQLLDPS